jgi:hypothetical protein
MAAATLRDPMFELTASLRQIFAEGLAVGFQVSSRQDVPP